MGTRNRAERTPRIQESGLETTGMAATRKGISQSAVHEAIRDGRLPAYRVSGPGRATYLLRPQDVDAVWPDEPAKDLPDLNLPSPS